MGAEGIIGLPVPTACSYQRIIVFWVRYDDLMESDVPTTIAEVCEHLDSSRGDLAVEQIGIKLAEEVLPLSGTFGLYRPYLLNHSLAFSVKS